MSKVSIIVPVYNAAETVRRTLDSIKNQTLTDFEVLLVDDGSTDHSGRICDEYASTDRRIRAIHKANGGVSVARQTGLEAAQGEYVIHADADDWIEPNMLEELYKKAKETDADVVICDYYVNDSNNERYVTQRPSTLDAQTVLGELFQQLHGSCWNKLARRVCYSRYGIRFPEGINYCEDLLTWIMLFKHDDVKVAYLPMAFYHYVINDNSITRNFTRKTYEMRLGFLDALKRLLAIPDSEDMIDKVSFSIFTEGIVFDVLNDNEIKDGLQVHKKQIKSLKSPRWKLGYFFLKYGFKGIAQKLIHY